MRRLLDKIRSFSQVDKGFAYVAFANIFSSVLGAAFWLILASILTADGYGEVNYYIALGGLLGTVAIVGGDTTIVTLVSRNQTRAKSELVSFICLITVAIAVPTLLISGHLSLAGMILGTVFFGMAYSEFLGYKLYKNYAMIQIGQKVVQAGLGISLYFVFGVQGVIYGYAISYLLFSYKYFFTLKDFTIDFGELKGYLKFMVHNYSNLMSRTMILYSDKLIIAPLYGFTTLGLYQIAAQFLMFLSIIPIIMYDYLLPQEARGVNQKRIKAYGFLTAIAIVALVEIFAPYIVSVLFPNFERSVTSIQIVTIGIIPMTYIMITIPKLLHIGKSKIVMIGSILFIGIQYLLILILGRIMDLEGLALSTLVGLSVQALYIWLNDRNSSNGAAS